MTRQDTSDALLERMIKEAETTPHPSPFNRELLPWFEGPWFDVARAAVESLKDPEEIRSFMEKYITHTQKEGNMSKESAEKSAKKAVGYCTGYVDDEQANKWFSALPDVTHPITGRERPFLIDKEVNMFYLIGKSGDKAVRDYILDNFEQGVMGLRLADPAIVQGRDNPEYFAVRLVIPEQGFSATDYYMLLAGYCEGVSRGMQERLGKKCKLVCEVRKKEDGR